MNNADRIAEFWEIGARVLADSAARRHAEDMRRLIDATSRMPPTRESLESRIRSLESEAARLSSSYDVRGNYMREAEDRAHARRLRAEAEEIRAQLVPHALQSLDPVMLRAMMPFWRV